MTREYGALIRAGLIVPPANSTVEPEMAAYLPRGAAIHAARLPGTVEQDTSRGLEDRIEGYLAALPDAVRSFGGMDLDAICLMHTGCSYVVGPQGEDRLREALDLSGAPHAFSAAEAIAEILAELGARRIALVVPYPDWLSRAAVSYWENRGLTVVDVAKPPDVVSIYEITPEQVLNCIRRLELKGTEAIVLSGTGMASLRALQSYAPSSAIPVVSSNLCSAWRMLSQGTAAGAELGDLALPMRELRQRLARA